MSVVSISKQAKEYRVSQRIECLYVIEAVICKPRSSQRKYVRKKFKALHYEEAAAATVATAIAQQKQNNPIHDIMQKKKTFRSTEKVKVFYTENYKLLWEIKDIRDICTSIFITALLEVGQRQNNLSVHLRMKKMQCMVCVCVYTMVYYSAFTRKEILSYATNG